MASKKSSKQRSQGGGRTANSEPRLQVFRDFAGCNFELSPREFTLGVEPDRDEQSDLQMNYVVVQNNARITSNKTIETRPNIVKVFERPDDAALTGVCLLVGQKLFAATTDHDIAYGDMFTYGTPGKLNRKVALDDVAGTGRHWWFSFSYADGKLVATTQENELWTGDIEDYRIANAKRIPDPDQLPFWQLEPQGTLKTSREFTEECCFRTAVAYSYVSKFGPTKVSRPTTFYSNVPVSEWHSGCWLRIHGETPYGYDVKAVEVYYNVDNASSLVFAGRVDEGDFKNGGEDWYFSWFGYLDVTSMWPMANLMAPTENYTKGVPATYAKCIDGRMYFWGSAFDPYRLYIGGNPGNMFSVSPGTGGGFVDVEPGTGQMIQFVDKYKTQSGNSIVTMLCSSENTMRDQRYNLVENTVTISNEQSMKSWQAEQVAGAVGCRSPHAAIVCEDGLYSVTSYGIALTTMTMEYNSQIRANYISDAVKPVFTDRTGFNLSDAILLEADGVLYAALNAQGGETGYDSILLCYDINAKAWWTYTVDLEEQILNLIHIDWASMREGIGIVTRSGVWMIPTTNEPGPDDPARFDVLIETGELAAQMPQQGWIHLSQLEFDFDRFLGDLDIDLVGIDQFGRQVTVHKHMHQPETVYGWSEFMRVDLKLRSYKLILKGRANFRLTHFMAKVYSLSSKIGLSWGFDDRMSFRSEGDIHPTFRSYNDVRDAIIP